MKKMKQIKYKDLRRIFRDFYNDSFLAVIGRENYVPHAGKDANCELCKIEYKAIRKIRAVYRK